MVDGLAIALAYLWGSVPTSYLVARLARGIDLRRYGSGNVGAANLAVVLGRRAGLLVGLWDCLGKGALPLALVRSFPDHLSPWIPVGVGLAVVAGHNWSPYLLFRGGRGVATAVGNLLGALLWPQLLLCLALLAAGRFLFRELGIFTFLALVAIPILTLLLPEGLSLLGRTPSLALTSGLAILLILKRLGANWERPAPGYALPVVLLRRLLMDRDVPRKERWVERRPVVPPSQ